MAIIVVGGGTTPTAAAAATTPSGEAGVGRSGGAALVPEDGSETSVGGSTDAAAAAAAAVGTFCCCCGGGDCGDRGGGSSGSRGGGAMVFFLPVPGWSTARGGGLDSGVVPGCLRRLGGAVAREEEDAATAATVLGQSAVSSAIAFGGATRLDGRRATRMQHPTLSAYGSKFAHARYGGFGSRWWRGAPCACGCGMILLGRGTVPTVKAGVGERGPKRLVGGARRHCIMCGRDYRMAS